MKQHIELNRKESSSTDLKVDVSVWQPAGTTFVQEVDIFNEEAEERNHNLEEGHDSRSGQFEFWTFERVVCVIFYLLLAAVCSFRPLGGATKGSAIVAEVTGWVHLVLREVRQ